MFNVVKLFIIFTITTVCCYAMIHFRERNTMKTLVNKLKSDGWAVFINANNCGYCSEQIKFFGSDFSDVDVIHCDDKNNEEVCKKIKAFPTWQKNGKLYSGGRFSHDAFRKLFEKSLGSRTPAKDDPS